MMSATPWNQQISAPYEHAEATAAMQPGPNALAGQVVFFQDPSAGRMTCARRGVTLLPLTPYARQWFMRHFGPSGFVARPTRLEGLSPTVKGFLAASRFSPCSDDGEFRFDHLKAGDFIVHASAEWQVGATTRGSTFYAVVRVADGPDTRVVLSSPYRSRDSTFPQPTVEFGFPAGGR